VHLPPASPPDLNMTNTAPPKFSSTKDEIEYWRKEAEQHKQGYNYTVKF